MERKSSRVSKDVKTQNKAKMPQKILGPTTPEWKQCLVKDVSSGGLHVSQGEWSHPRHAGEILHLFLHKWDQHSQQDSSEPLKMGRYDTVHPLQRLRDTPPRKSSWRSEQRRSHHLCFLLSGKMKKLYSPAGWSLAGIQGASFSCGHL